MSKYTYNAQLYYDTSKFSTRLAYNYCAKYRADPYLQQPGYTQFTMPISRLAGPLSQKREICFGSVPTGCPTITSRLV